MYFRLYLSDMTDSTTPTTRVPALVPADVAQKSGEKLLDYLKADVERVTAETRVAEDRARGNATVAAAALPLLTLLRSIHTEPTYLEQGLTALLIVLIVAVLTLLIGVMWNRKTSRTPPDWYMERQNDIYHQHRAGAYDRFLHEIQSMWIGYFEDALRVRHSKYAWLHWQNVTTFTLLLVFCALLFLTFR